MPPIIEKTEKEVPIPDAAKEMKFSLDDLNTVDSPTPIVEPTEQKVETKVEDKKPDEQKVEDKKVEDKKVETTPTKTENKKVEEVPPTKAEDKTPVKVEDKKVDDKQKKEDTKPGRITQISPVKPKADDKKDGNNDPFDYSGFSEQEVTNLKNMSRQSREWVAGIVKASKNGGAKSTGGDQLYLQHEDAYKLTPEYNNAVSSYERAITEKQIYQQTLLDLRNGKDIRDLKGFDKNTGQAVFGEPRKATAEDDINLHQYMIRCDQHAQRMAQEATSYQGRYKQQVTNDLKVVNDECAARFAWCADPSLLDATVQTDTKGEIPIRQVIEDFKSVVPQYMSSHPMTNVAAHIFTAMQIQGMQMRELQQKLAAYEIKTSEKKHDEPTSHRAEAKGRQNKFGGPATFSAEGVPL